MPWRLSASSAAKAPRMPSYTIVRLSFVNALPSIAEYVENMREATLNPLNDYDAELAAEFADLMRKITA
jgi:hypothetical protein